MKSQIIFGENVIFDIVKNNPHAQNDSTRKETAM